MSLAQVLEWKYGPIASTGSIVEVDYKNFIKDEDIFSSNKKGTRLKIFQIAADKYGLEYDHEKIAMVITGWKSDKKQPDDKQLEKDFKEYEAHLVSEEYILKRVDEYPSVGDQLDAIWKALSILDLSAIPEAEAMLVTINGVKTKYPKP